MHHSLRRLLTDNDLAGHSLLIQFYPQTPKYTKLIITFNQKSFQILNLFQFNSETGLCTVMKDSTPKLRLVLVLLFGLITFLSCSLMRKQNSSWKKKQGVNRVFGFCDWDLENILLMKCDQRPDGGDKK